MITISTPAGPIEVERSATLADIVKALGLRIVWANGAFTAIASITRAD